MKSLIAAGHVNTNGEFAVITQIMRLYMYIEPVWHVLSRSAFPLG